MANSQGEDPVKAALERLKAKKAETATPVQTKANGEPDNSELMAQRKARRLAKQAEEAQQAAVSDENVTKVEVAEDPRKEAVAAALARAKAKKEAQQAVVSDENVAKTEVAEDPRKAAVVAAIARAKAKKETKN